jgi:hypothetical protein
MTTDKSTMADEFTTNLEALLAVRIREYHNKNGGEWCFVNNFIHTCLDEIYQDDVDDVECERERFEQSLIECEHVRLVGLWFTREGVCQYTIDLVFSIPDVREDVTFWVELENDLVINREEILEVLRPLPQNVIESVLLQVRTELSFGTLKRCA